MPEVGDRVLIVQGKEYRGRFIGNYGEVVRITRPPRSPSIKVGVLIDDHPNDSSRYLAYWFEADSLQTSYEEDYNMDTNTIFIQAKMLGHPEYANQTNLPSYTYSTIIPDLQPGDILVVHTAKHGLAVAEFIEYTETKATSGREVVAKVDISEYQARKEAAKKLASLRQAMDKRLRESQTLALYEALAQTDDEMLKLLNEYKQVKEAGQLNK